MNSNSDHIKQYWRRRLHIRQEIEWSWNFYKKNWEKLLVIFVIPIVINTIIMLPMMFLMIFSMIFAIPLMGDAGLIALIAISCVMFMFVIVVAILMVIVQGATYACTRDVMRGTYKSYWDLWENTKKYWRGILKITLLLWLIIFGVIAVLGALVAIPIIWFLVSGEFESAMCGMCLAYVVMIIVLMIFGTCFGILDMLSKIIYLTDECRPGQAVKRAFKIFFTNLKEMFIIALLFVLVIIIANWIPMGSYLVGLVIVPVLIVYLFRFYSKKGRFPHKYRLIDGSGRINMPKGFTREEYMRLYRPDMKKAPRKKTIKRRMKKSQ